MNRISSPYNKKGIGMEYRNRMQKAKIAREPPTE